MSILDAAPKTSVRFLLGRNQELVNTVKSVVEHRITIVLGPRRIGKTSIVKTALSILSGKEELKELKLKDRFIPIYVDMWSIIATSRSSRNFFRYLDATFSKVLEEYDKALANDYKKRMHLVEESIERAGGIDTLVRFGGKKGIMYRYPYDEARCLDELNAILARHGRRAVLAIDEAQELGTLKPFSPTAWLAHIHDHLTQIHVLLSGSYVGLLKRVLHPRQRDPLYGRDINRINVGKLKPVSLLLIFLQGLNERGVTLSKEIQKALDSIESVAPFSEKAQVMPFSKVAFKEVDEKMRQLMSIYRDIFLRQFHVEDPDKLLDNLVTFLSIIMNPWLSSLLVYYAANVLLEIGFDPDIFSQALPEKRIEEIRPFMDFLSSPGTRALAVLSLFISSGSPSLIISLAKRMPNNFTAEDLLRIGLQVLDEGYRAVCDEVNRFIRSYSKKPEIIITILYSLYSSPRIWSSIAQILMEQGIDKKSVNENLRTLVELGYITKYREGINTYYYITDPLLFYALKVKCIKT